MRTIKKINLGRALSPTEMGNLYGKDNTNVKGNCHCESTNGLLSWCGDNSNANQGCTCYGNGDNSNGGSGCSCGKVD